MRIQHNISAMNSYRNFSANASKLNKNLEKLSTGYKINRAGDDAAGLAISEKMRVQISGIEGATKNAKDGISLVQTAEGALTEVHDMLNRMVTLTEQSANGTYDNELDRNQLQKEVDALKSEIDRIADSTNYNGIKLLDGSLSTEGIAKAAAENIDLSKIGINIAASGQEVAATNGKYGTSDLMKGSTANIGGVDPATTLNVGDKFDFTIRYTDEDGKDQTKTITLRVADNTTTASSGVVLDDGTEKGVDLGIGRSASAVNTIVASDMAKLVQAAINKDEDLKSAFKVELANSNDATSNRSVYNASGTALTFEARTGGTSGAVLKDYSFTYTKLGDTTPTGTATSKTSVVTEAVDAGKAYDLSQATLWDGKESTLKDAIFEVNGEKFVFASKDISSDGKLTEDQKTMLSEAGVGNNVVTGVTAFKASDGSGGVLGSDVLEMQKLIEKATGLKTTRYTATYGTTANGETMDIKTIAKDGNGTSEDASAGTTNPVGTSNGARSTFVKFDVPTSLATAKTLKGGLTLQIGDTSDEFNRMTVSIEDMHAKSIGIGDVDISTQEGAAKAIDQIKSAVNFVSNTRGTLGALQNRLDHTINNLGVMRENIQSAESLIRDTDVAEEMMTYTKNNILNQSAQAMLAQANQLPQGVLQLLG